MSTRMTKSEREAFLAVPRIAVLHIEVAAAAPVVCPVWFDYEPDGDIRVMTTRESQKGRAFTLDGHCTVCVPDERPPYAYVTVEGAVTSIEDLPKEEYRPMARRYLGIVDGDAFTELTATPDDIVVRIRPDRWLTADFHKVFGTAFDSARPE